MIDNYEKETAPLTDYERNTLLPMMVRCLKRHIGKENAVTNRQMIDGLEAKGFVVGSSARVRKLINRIRVDGLIECLMATSVGYYITDDETEMKGYIDSLKGREEAICAVKDAMQIQLESLIQRRAENTRLE